MQLMCATAVVVAWAIPVFAWAQSAPDATPESMRVGPTLHERVATSGTDIEESLEPEDLPIASLVELERRSRLVIVGRVLGVRSQLAQDDRRVDTELAVRVLDSVKGPLRGGAIVYARVPGGAHRFADGRIARQAVAGFRSVQPESTCVLYLRPIPVAGAAPRFHPGDGSGRLYRAEYELAVGPQGVFQLDFASGLVVPAAVRPDHPLAARYVTTSVVDFLAELHQSVVR